MFLNNVFRFGFCMLFILGSVFVFSIEYNKISYFMII